MAGFLAELGLRIHRNGYNIIPIKPGEKFPVIKGWQKIETTPADIAKWRRNGHADAGVGITCGKISFFDIDCYDVEAALETQDDIETTLGFAPLRIGNPPKRGLMYRTETPFRKVTSKVWIDGQGRECRLEVLGVGQQFVSHHIHPDTKKPYQWPRPGDDPEVLPADELPVATEAKAHELCERFNERAAAHGWKVKKAEAPKTSGAVLAPSRYGTTIDDEFGLGTERIGLSDEELLAKVMAIPNGIAEDWPYGDDPDTETIGWFKIMAAIHHETGGSDFGRSVALAWSELSPKHTDEMFDKTWPSFGQGGQRPLTARYILRWARFYEKIAVAAQLGEVLLSMDVAGDLGELKTAALEAKKLDVDMMDRGRLIAALQRNARRFGVSIGVKEARELIRYDPEKTETPDWLKGWVYLSHADRFFNIVTKHSYTEKAFDNTFSRYTGDMPPSVFALTKAKIEIVFMAGYLPGADDFFVMNGNRFANTYSERNVPPIPAKLEGTDRENVQRVARHFANLFPDQREREIAISWYANIVQTKQRPNWAMLLQGVEGDGRTFFANMMSAVLGGDNVITINAKTLEDRFTGWAKGHLLAVIEEVRMIGHNRYDVLNGMKPYITNATAEIREMRVDVYNVPNTTAYMLTTNYQNALPVNDSDRRYFILMSQWQSAAAINKFMTENPTYFDDLYNALDESPGAILGWLKAYKLHPEFKPRGRAPNSHGRQRMIEQNKSDDSLFVDDILADARHPDICDDLVIVSSLRAVLTEQGGIAPQTRAIDAILREAGFTYLGRAKIDGKNESIWSKNPRKFGRDLTTQLVYIRHYLANPL